MLTWAGCDYFFYSNQIVIFLINDFFKPKLNIKFKKKTKKFSGLKMTKSFVKKENLTVAFYT